MGEPKPAPTRDQRWSVVRNDNDYAEDKLMVTITLAEYRELVRKATVLDEREGGGDGALS